jgi:pimeloyl-ACP methyl ester carboxylesterase
MANTGSHLVRFATTSIRGAAILLLWGCSQPSVGEIREFAIAKTGGQFCTPKNATAQKSLDRSDMLIGLIGGQSPLCTAWLGAMEGVSAIAGQVELKSGFKPVVVYANDPALNTPNTVQRVIIRIVGGPGLRIGPKSGDADYLGRSSISTMMVTLGYSGTGHYSRYPEQNFQPAIDEFVQLTEFLCTKMPNAKFLIIGESLGAPIAIEATRRISICRNRLNSLLFSPMIRSPSEQLIYAEKYFYTLTHNKKTIVVGVLNKAGRVETRFAQLSLAESLPKFFAKPDQHVSLYDRLKLGGIEINRIHMLVGDKDSVTGIEENARFAATFRDRTTVIKGMGHGPGPEHGREVAEAVDAAFSP